VRVAKATPPTKDLSKLITAIDSDELVVGVRDVPEDDWLNLGIPELNEIITGNRKHGIPLGCTVEISGDSQTGKTKLMAHLMRRVQKKGGIVALADAESSFNKKYVTKVHKVDTDAIMLIKTNVIERIIAIIGKVIKARKKELTKANMTYEKLVPVIMFIDSFKMCVSEKEVKAGEDNYGGYGTARTMAFSQQYPKVHYQLCQFRITVVWINQVRAKFGFMQSGKESTGGEGMKFYPDIRLRLKNLGRIKKTKNKIEKVIGRKVEIECIKTRFNEPNGKIRVQMMHKGGYTLLEGK